MATAEDAVPAAEPGTFGNQPWPGARLGRGGGSRLSEQRGYFMSLGPGSPPPPGRDALEGYPPPPPPGRPAYAQLLSA